MKKTIAMLMALAGMAAVASAQDSVSTNPDGGDGLPGDALSPWSLAPSYQRSSFIVDMVPLTTSWGQQLGIAPVLKTSKTSITFFGSLLSASTMSSTQLTGVNPVSGSYDLWTTRGAGVSQTENNRAAVTSVPAEGPTNQFGIAMSEFGTYEVGGSLNGEQVISALVNYSTSNPARLMVTKYVAMTNRDGVNGPTSSPGLGMIDSSGNQYFRADNFGTSGTSGTPVILGNNVFRVDLLARNTSALNWISDSGASDTGVRLVNNYGNTVNCPSAIPEQVVGGDGVMITTNFDRGLNYGPTAPATTDNSGAHRPGTSDHRGNAIFHPANLLNTPNAVGTMGMLAITGNRTDTLNLWSVDANGAVVGTPLGLVLSSGPSDPVSISPYTFPWNTSGTLNDFRSYEGNTAFRGSNPMAIGRDAQGRLLASGILYDRAGTPAPNNANRAPSNAIAVARRTGTNTQWVIAGWVNDLGTTGSPGYQDYSAFNRGKEIYGDGGLDGVIGTGDSGDSDGNIDLNPLSPTYDAPIGRMASAREVYSSRIGPSVSPPAFDAAGNVYFTSCVILKKRDQNGQYFGDLDRALIRARYDSSSFSYRLEKIIELGQTFLGANSNTRWQLQELFVSASGAGGPTATWFHGSSVAPYAFNNADPTTLEPTDVRTLGGLILNAIITYDIGSPTNPTEPDGLYQDPTGSSGVPLSPDESYNVVLYIGNTNGTEPDPCAAFDLNGDTVVDFNDYLEFLNLFNAEDPRVDFNADGVVDFNDYLEFLNGYNACQ